MTGLGSVGTGEGVSAQSVACNGSQPGANVARAWMPAGMGPATRGSGGTTLSDWTQVLQSMGITRCGAQTDFARTSSQQASCLHASFRTANHPTLRTTQMSSSDFSTIEIAGSEDRHGHATKGSERNQRKRTDRTERATPDAVQCPIAAWCTPPSVESGSSHSLKAPETAPVAKPGQPDVRRVAEKSSDVSAFWYLGSAAASPRRGVEPAGTHATEMQAPSLPGQQEARATAESAQAAAPDQPQAPTEQASRGSDTLNTCSGAITAAESRTTGATFALRETSPTPEPQSAAKVKIVHELPDQLSHVAKTARSEAVNIENTRHAPQARHLQTAEAGAPVGDRVDTAVAAQFRPISMSGERLAEIHGQETPDSHIGAKTALPNSAASNAHATLDAKSAEVPARWTSSDPRSVAAGFQDPELGWVSVRAHTDASGLHATVIPSSQEAGQVLAGHMAGLAAHLSDRVATIDTLTIAVSADASSQSAMSHDGRNLSQQHTETGTRDRPEADGLIVRSNSMAGTANELGIDFDTGWLPTGATFSRVA